jgi:hypothetical protein
LEAEIMQAPELEVVPDAELPDATDPELTIVPDVFTPGLPVLPPVFEPAAPASEPW